MSKIAVVLFGAGKIGQAAIHLLDKLTNRSVDLTIVEESDKVLDTLVEKFNLFKFKKTTLVNTKCGSYKSFLEREFTPTARRAYCVNAMPFHTSAEVASWAVKQGLHYLDFTEDVEQRQLIKDLTNEAIDAGVALMPGMGLAPGLINTKAGMMILDAIEEGGTEIECKLRVGALSTHVNNDLNYNFTWSPVGVANEYVKRDLQLVNGQLEDSFPLMGVEQLFIEGTEYEAFNTAGGIGTLLDDFEGLFKKKINGINYKSIRNKGHRDALVFRLHGPKSPEFMLSVLQRDCPIASKNDYVIMFVCVQYRLNGILHQRDWSKVLYPSGELQAIQWVTALGLVTNLISHASDGLVKQSGFFNHLDLAFPTEIIQNGYY